MKLTALLTAGALASGALGATPVAAQRYGHDGHHWRHGYGNGYRGGYGFHRGYGYPRGYGFHRRYYGYGPGFYRHHYGCRRFGYYHQVRRCFY